MATDIPVITETTWIAVIHAMANGLPHTVANLVADTGCTIEQVESACEHLLQLGFITGLGSTPKNSLPDPNGHLATMQITVMGLAEHERLP